MNGLVLGLLAMVFWLLALVSYSAQDAAWSTSGAGGGAMGQLGALWRLAGRWQLFSVWFSVWWCVAAGVRAWLSSLARWMRGGEPCRVQRPMAPGCGAPCSGAVVAAGAPARRWSGRACIVSRRCCRACRGMLGYVMGPLAVKWLGFAGSGPGRRGAGGAGRGAGVPLSWGHLAERLGARIDAWCKPAVPARETGCGRGQTRRARAPGGGAGRAAREVQHPQPVRIIEPCCRMRRRARAWSRSGKSPVQRHARQPPAAGGLAGCGQARQGDGVARDAGDDQPPDREKLKDFGVEVTVVAAQPGPVITRYEIGRPRASRARRS